MKVIDHMARHMEGALSGYESLKTAGMFLFLYPYKSLGAIKLLFV